MKRITVIMTTLFVLVFSIVLSPANALAETNTTILELSNTTEHGYKQNVTITGEVVGDILNAEPGYKWLLLQDGGATISVLVSDSDAEKVTHLGRYGQVGTQLEVSGEFKVDCEEHDGLTDIHATSVTVLNEGYYVVSFFDSNKLKLGAVLILVGVGLVFLHWRLRERTR